MLNSIRLFLTKKAVRIAMLTLTVISVFVSYYRFQDLYNRSTEKTLDFSHPFSANVNTEGYATVLDSFGSSIAFLSPEKKALATVACAGISGNTPKQLSYVFMDDEHVYAVDSIMMENGTNPIGERLLCYDLYGNFKKVLLTYDETKVGNHTYRVQSGVSHGGHIYLSMLDESDPYAVTVAEVADGKLRIIHEYTGLESECYDAEYQPERDITTAVAYDGTVFVWKDGVKNSYRLDGSRPLPEKIFVLGDDSAILLDSNANAIYHYENIFENGLTNGTPIAETSTKTFSVTGDKLVYVGLDSGRLHIRNLSTGEEELYTEIFYADEVLVRRTLVRLTAILGALSLLLFVGSILWNALWKRARAAKLRIIGDLDAVKPMTVALLYRPAMVSLLCIFGITALVSGYHFYRKNVQDKGHMLANIAYGMSRASGDTIGSSIDKIQSCGDFDSEAYKRIENFTSSICMIDVDSDDSFNLFCRVYRYLDGGTEVLTVKDDYQFYRIGCVLTADEQIAYGMYPLLRDIRSGEAELLYSERYYGNGTVYEEVYTPIYNEKGEVTGAIVTFMNKKMVETVVLKELLDVYLEIFTFLTGIIFLYVEGKYLWETRLIQKQRHKAGVWGTTVREADRSLNIFSNIPNDVFGLFCTVITLEIMSAQGLSGAVMLALPATTMKVVSSIAKKAMARPAGSHPRRWMYISMLAMALSMALLAVAAGCASYALILLGALINGMAGGTFGAARSRMDKGDVPEGERYKYMFHTNTEGAISAAIGTSLGAVCREMGGDAAMAGFGIFICLIPLVAARYLVGDDIREREAVPKNRKTRAAKRQAAGEWLKKNGSFFLRPNVVAVLLLGIPLTQYLHDIKSYIMPLFNVNAGYSDIYIGALSLVSGLVSVFVVPELMRVVRRHGERNNHTIIGIEIAMAVVMTLFGMIPDIRSLIIIMIMAPIANSAVGAISGDVNTSEAKLVGLDPDDTDMGFFIVKNAARFTSNIVLSLTIIGSYALFGYIWAGLCVICAFLVLLQMRRQKEKEKREAAAATTA